VLWWWPRLVVGRSQSDGKEKFVFFSAASYDGSFGRWNQKGPRGTVEGAASAGSAGGAGAGVHAWSYVNNNNGGGARRRRSSCPTSRTSSGCSPTPSCSAEASKI
jgi:hypothetical protein